ncbi:MAG TPA: hypothetical protein VKX28_26575 [Xanthobacteraceae bacterium]|nr:hypothetical protein [Xanthobacteraceae bacterium]
MSPAERSRYQLGVDIGAWSTKENKETPMTGQLKLALVVAAAVFCLLGTTMQSQALNCQRGSFTTSRCFRSLEQQIGQAQGIEDCVKEMEAEYSGRNGSAGAGRNFNADEQRCRNLIASLSRGVQLDQGGADNADANSAMQAVKSWASH